MDAVEKNDGVDNQCNKLAEDYAKFFKLDTTNEKIQLENEIETLMTQLEEYKFFLKQNSSQNQDLLNEKVPKIFTHYQTLLRTFQSIDNLESLVGDVKHDLLQLENDVTKAEKDLKVGPNITDVLKPLLFKKDSSLSNYIPAARNETLTYTRPTLKFKPENYFPPKIEASEDDN